MINAWASPTHLTSFPMYEIPPPPPLVVTQHRPTTTHHSHAYIKHFADDSGFTEARTICYFEDATDDKLNFSTIVNEPVGQYLFQTFLVTQYRVKDIEKKENYFHNKLNRKSLRNINDNSGCNTSTFAQNLQSCNNNDTTSDSDIDSDNIQINTPNANVNITNNNNDNYDIQMKSETISIKDETRTISYPKPTNYLSIGASIDTFNGGAIALFGCTIALFGCAISYPIIQCYGSATYD